jgi:hypothetical protein
MTSKKLYTELTERATYIAKNTLNPQKTWVDNVNNYQNTHLIEWFNKNNYRDFFYNKIIVDAGSGLGGKIPLLSFFKPKKIISVEPNSEFLEKQKEFLDSKFYFLPNKKINCDLEYLNISIEDFIDGKYNFDILCLFYTHPYIDIRKVLTNINKDVIILSNIKHLNKGNLLDIIKENNLNYSYFEFTSDEKWVIDDSHFLISIKNNA